MRKVLFSNYINDLFSEENISYYKNENELTEQEIEERIYEDNDYEWNSFELLCDEFFSDKTFVVTGKIGCWDGVHEGGKIFNNFNELMDILVDLDYIKFEDVNGHLFIYGTHHDSHNFYEVKEVTHKGNIYTYRNKNFMTRKELVEKIFNSKNYSKLPRLFKKFYLY